MIHVTATRAMEIGKKYKFVLQNGTTCEVVIHGSKDSPSGTIWQIEVDGVRGEFGGLDKAIGPYLSSSEA
ncbi:MAG: hypothetical protein KDJ14_07540 [Xanthomonadales bacterium]|nr:hypothetical protein [Xanthomonadales bacterium]